jgi:hypothetical protein
MFHEQPISGFFLRNDLVDQACYSVVAFFIVLSSAVIELRNTDVMAGPQLFFSEMCIRMHEISNSDSIRVEEFHELLALFFVGLKVLSVLRYMYRRRRDPIDGDW